MNRADQPHRLWRVFFGAAAAFNTLVALPALLGAQSVADRLVAVFVLAFGLVYALVAWQPARLAPVLWAGVFGKGAVLVLMVPEVLAGRAAPGTGAVLTGDALFTIGFLLFLLGRR